jgi:NAD(P)H-quinone oxidoreductase subunit 2
MSSLKVALIFCVLVTAIGGIISNPLFNFADSAVNGTPLLREAITLASKSSIG